MMRSDQHSKESGREAATLDGQCQVMNAVITNKATAWTDSVLRESPHDKLMVRCDEVEAAEGGSASAAYTVTESER